MAKPSIAVIQHSEAFCDFWHDLARDLDASVDVRGDDQLGTMPPGTAVVILAAGGEEDEALEWLASNQPLPADLPVLAVGTDTSRRTAVRLVGWGARDYLALPEDVEVLRSAVATAVERRRQMLEHEARSGSNPRIEAFGEIVGESPAIRELLSRAARLLSHPKATVLITGETGTGKELLARALHAGGERRTAPFVPVNCSALPENLIESELFGHERGSFTGAHAAKQGLFQVAQGGTLFLDEIGELPLELQAKLLRVLDDKVIRRVGGTTTVPVDTRIMAATNVNLPQAVQAGTFREDLFFRLSVITLSLPSLRERGEDVIHISEALLQRLAAEHEVPVPKIPEKARHLLRSCRWPGNVRELKNSLERALLLSDDGELCTEELQPQAAPAPEPESNGRFPFPAPLDVIVRTVVTATLDHFDGNRSESARVLGITRKRLRRILERPDPRREPAEPVESPVSLERAS